MLNSDGTTTPELLTLHQAAELCNVSDRTLWKWARSGISPAPRKFGSSKQSTVRYVREEYEAWVRNHCEPVKEGGADMAKDATQA